MASDLSAPPPQDRPLLVARGVHWVGFWDAEAGLHCNPYLIVDGEEAVLIDGGSRPDFSTVMMKIRQTGISPHQIRALIYHHYDPDLCGSVTDLEGVIKRDDLRVISSRPNHMFIRHYSVSAPLRSFADLDYRFRFTSGRELRFALTPFAHSAGNFVTFDPTSGVLFTSDLLGTFGRKSELFLNLGPDCHSCRDRRQCPLQRTECQLRDLARFHKVNFPSEAALRLAVRVIRTIPFRIIAPQHGYIIRDPKDAALVLNVLEALRGVGIDGVLSQDPDHSSENW